MNKSKQLKEKNLALFAILAAMVVILFSITLIRFGGAGMSGQ